MQTNHPFTGHKELSDLANVLDARHPTVIELQKHLHQGKSLTTQQLRQLRFSITLMEMAREELFMITYEITMPDKT